MKKTDEIKTRRDLADVVRKNIVKANSILDETETGIEIDCHRLNFDGCFEELNSSTETNLSWYKVTLEYHNLETGKCNEVTIQADSEIDEIVDAVK